MNEIIVKRIKAARLERKLTQQDLADHLGRTAAAISDLERGKVQVSASDLYKLAQLLNKPIEYFFGEDYLDKDVQDIISIVRKMSPEARSNQLPLVAMFLQMQEIGDVINSTDDKNEQLELAKQFYNLFLPFAATINKSMSQLNDIRMQLERLLGIEQTTDPCRIN